DLRPAESDAFPLLFACRGRAAADRGRFRRRPSASPASLQLDRYRAEAGVTNGWRLDPRRLLDLPIVFRWLYAVVGSREWRIFAEEYVRARPGDRILDIGCGPADVVAVLPRGIEYTGVDVNERYVRAAERRFAARGRFFCRALDRGLVAELGPGRFDIVVAHGLVHHLDDGEAAEFFALART